MSLSLGLGLWLANRGASSSGDIDEMAYVDSWFGDGSDGNVTISGAVTLTRDMFYDTLTIAAGAALNTGGFRIFCKTLLDLSAAPTNAITFPAVAGQSSSGTSGATQPTVAVVSTWQRQSSPVAGISGGTSAGSNGSVTNLSAVIISGGAGGAGGTGGDGSSGSGGVGGAITASLVTGFVWRIPTLVPGTNFSVIGGAQGCPGGSAGGDGSAGGGSGSGGGNGGMIAIFAKTINRSSANSNTGIIAVKGGSGGNGGAPLAGNRGGGGGGAGAGGGSIYIVTAALTGTTHTNALDVSGGVGGNGGAKTGTGTNGGGGQAGFGGKVAIVNIGASPLVVTSYDGTAVGGAAASGVTGGAQIAAQCNL